jgi:splicing factor 3B subunit 2
VFDLKLKSRFPENIEWADTTSKNPDFLIYLKDYRNTIPVPAHWSQKKKFLELRRGGEKMPFTLPENIEATGIAKIRA